MAIYTQPLQLNEAQTSDLFFAFAGYYIDAKSGVVNSNSAAALLEDAAQEFSELTDASVEDLIKDYNSRV